jgi:predicted dehydrogenase
MAQAPVNVGIIGCGIFGEVHAAAYSDFEQSNLVAVCDLNADRAKRLGEQFGCRHCTSVDDIAGDPAIQAVSVVTPDFAHREVCVTLARAGKHLLVEKPLATTVADAEAIAGAVRDAGVVGMVDFHNRYHPALRTVKESLDRGEMGELQMMYARLSDRIEVATEWFTWSGRSGPEWFLGSHLADLACWMFGEEPRRVFAEGRKEVLAARGIDCYDSVQIHLSFSKGFATLETSWIIPNTWPMIVDSFSTFQATEARADVDLKHQGITIAAQKRYDSPGLYGRRPVGADVFGFFAFPIRDFVRSVLSRTAPPVPLEAGVKNVKILAAAVESMKSGKVVELRWQD